MPAHRDMLQRSGQGRRCQVEHEQLRRYANQAGGGEGRQDPSKVVIGSVDGLDRSP